jgi:hypothetical protein
MIVLETDLGVPKDVDRVDVLATRRGVTLLDQHIALGADRLLPTNIELLADRAGGAPVVVQAVARKAGLARIVREAVTTIPATRIAALHLPLNYLCDKTAIETQPGQVTSTCPAGLTCSEGACVPSDVPESSLPDFTPGGSKTNGAASGGDTCFDVLRCFANAIELPLDLSDCSVDTPPGATPQTLTFAMKSALRGPGICDASACWVVLDAETFSPLDASLGPRVKLPIGVCTARSKGTAFAIAATTACPSMTNEHELCPVVASPPGPATTEVGHACPADATDQSCGQCGTRSRVCTNGDWSPWGPCIGAGPCAQGTRETCDGTGTRTCGSSCQWSACSTVCAVDAPPETQACGDCGTQARHCTSGKWSDWSTCAQGACHPGSRRACTAGSGIETCNVSCQWPGQCQTSANDIVRFSIDGIDATVDDIGSVITLTVPPGTDLKALVPTIEINGTTVWPPSGVAQDFTKPVTYVVTHADGTTKTYTAIVSPTTLADKDITRFSILGVDGTITGTNIALTLPVGTTVNFLTPTIVTTGRSVTPLSGVAIDFTGPVTYTVTARDGTTKTYTVNVTAALPGSKEITQFTLLGVDATITGTSIALTLPSGTDLTSLTPTIAITGASVAPASGVAQSFVGPASYTVTAANGSTASYLVTVTVLASPPGMTSPVQFSAAGGSYANPVDLLLSTATAGATICYTIDGPSPSCAGGCLAPAVTYTSTPILLDAPPGGGTPVVRAIACSAGNFDSNVVTASYSFRAAMPTAAPFSTEVSYGANVALDTLTGPVGAPSLRWNTDATDPSCILSESNVPAQSASVSITQNVLFRAIACRQDYAASPVASLAYTVKLQPPVLVPPPGIYTSPQIVAGTESIPVVAPTYQTPPGGTGIVPACSTATGCTSGTPPVGTLCYTNDGSPPACSVSGTSCVGPATPVAPTVLAAGTTVSVRACRPGFTASDAVVGAYDLAVAPICVTGVAGGNANSISPYTCTTTANYWDGGAGKAFLLNTATTGEDIRYSTDGSDVTCNQACSGNASCTQCTSPSPDNGTCQTPVLPPFATLKAVGCKANLADSSPRSLSYADATFVVTLIMSPTFAGPTSSTITLGTFPAWTSPPGTYTPHICVLEGPGAIPDPTCNVITGQCSGASIEYLSPFFISGSGTTVKAIACKSGVPNASAIQSFTQP